MNKLALSAILATGLLSTGCIITTDDNPPIDETGAFTVTWEVDSCPPDAIAVVNSDPTGGGEPFTDTFNCVDGSGTASDLPLGTYDVYVEIATPDNAELYGLSDYVTATLAFDGDLVQVDVPTFSTTTGYFELTWSIEDSQGELTCEEATVDGVGIDATLASTNQLYDATWDCIDGGGITSAFPVGEYEIIVSLTDENNDTLLNADQFTDSIDYGNQIKDLLNVGFFLE